MNKQLVASVIIASSLAATAMSCDDTGRAGGRGEPAARAEQPRAGRSPVAVTATALFAEHVAAGGYLPDLGTKYDGGALVSGTVGSIITDLGTTFVQLRAGDQKRVALTFSDQGAGVRAKQVKIDDEITVLCQLGGMGGDAQAILGDCALQ